jgi:signal peptidase I
VSWRPDSALHDRVIFWPAQRGGSQHVAVVTAAATCVRLVRRNGCGMVRHRFLMLNGRALYMENLPGKGHRARLGTDGVTRRATFAAAASVLVSGTLASCSAAKPPGVVDTTGMTHLMTVGSDSMNPTIVKGQVITVDGLIPGTYKPHRQDIVIVHPTATYQGIQQTSLMIRRVIGIPGDTVSCYGGPLMLNGAALNEPYLHKGDAPSMLTFDVKIPTDCLWLLGDHRTIALDCRYHLFDPDHGAIPIANVAGIYHQKA